MPQAIFVGLMILINVASFPEGLNNSIRGAFIQVDLSTQFSDPQCPVRIYKSFKDIQGSFDGLR